ncbi:MAG: YqeY-like protein [Candidatus Woesebacteria bacterium GW2011_GWF1_40_24]|uniref:YqeY-like protein n=4 Tax=Candidatus Woeseibacteriota TaxID=1752722 RepID=A0A0G0RXN1_9BACT|nr:MAG: YqeY-like protein [Candidatus Woesebacteria bacterium GW2011_GWB1_40_12]KKR54691.1 MAG: YqeY-like protein [Candidatus Woesebacteria bacterium GW2011_GWF1_40_24]KKS04544.1 MAG: YqeY-like protein [Candidatus Woesebacteria bacterium GW2011_GWE1_41_24]KKS17172.1 MAG: YqeY-like protein [Candidatus Woesebacteria bacterium GW2011_GWA1_41_7]HBB76567.1 glutamyl-tRNA amidotransferase [Candidatus Levybacteria bacterium]
MITPSLQEKIGVAMKAHDEVRVSTLRLLLSAFNYEQIAKQHELTEEEELAVIRREAKKRKEAIEMYKNAGAVDRAAKEAAELEILGEYLPPDMSDEELVKLVADAIIQIKPSGMADMGKVIGLVKSRAPDADGGKIAQLVKEKLG